MENFPQLSPFIITTLVMFATLGVKWLLTILIPHQPLSFFAFYCEQLAKKVNKTANATSQQKVAGFLAMSITLIPIIIILWLFEDFIVVPVLWQSLILYVALSGTDTFALSKRVAKSLAANQNYEAKQALSNVVLRQTENLSTLGLSKACIEMQVLRISQQIVTVCFFFLAFGPLAALTVRLLIEMHYCWNVKEERFKDFSTVLHFLVQILLWIPTRFFAIAIWFGTIGRNAFLNWRLIFRQLFALDSSAVLHISALSLGCKLGGVAMYSGQKLRKVSFNDHGKQPEISDIIHMSSKLKQGLLVLTIFVVIAITVVTALTV